MTTQTQYTILGGWYEVISEGVGTFYLCITDEGIVTSPTDTPANAQFRPRILNPEEFSIRRAPPIWPLDNTQQQNAAFGQLILDNYDGAFNFMLSADIRDSVCVLKMVKAAAFIAGTGLNDAPTIATMIVDDASSDDEKHITVTFKDTIARLDKALPCRFNPPFVAAGAANTMIPLTFGAVRNITPLLVDQANRIYQLHDSIISNVVSVSDRAAPLDPNASPPQYTPALSNSGLALQTEIVNFPNGKLTCDCSSFGVQATIPGVADVLAGAGLFTGTWAGSPAVPPGWTWTHGVGSSITKVLGTTFNPALPGPSNAAIIQSGATPFVPGSGSTEDLYFPAILQPGRAYRVSFGVAGIASPAPINGGNRGGLMVTMDPAGQPIDFIAGYLTTLYQNFPGVEQTFTFEFRVPAGPSALGIHFLIVPSTDGATTYALGKAQAVIFGIRLELLGQFTQLPLAGIPLNDLFTEILVNRANESPAIFNAAEAAALTARADGSVIPIGMNFTAPPNILQMMQIALDTLGATKHTDNLGVLRFPKFVDPTDPANLANVLCDFSPINVELPYTVATIRATKLTTLFGARRNWTQFTDSDFVTDQDIVSLDTKTRFKRVSQYETTSSRIPAGQYASAIGAKIFDTLFDLIDDAQTEGDRMVGIFSPTVYADGTSTTGKRQLVRFTARFDDVAAIGVTIIAAVTDIMFGKIIRFTLPNDDGSPRFVNQLSEIIEWDLFPFAQKITIGVMI